MPITTSSGQRCWVMRSMTLALAASIQWMSSTTSSVRPCSTAALTTSKAAVVGSAWSRRGSPASPATASPGRPSDPGWAVATSVTTDGGQRVDQLADEPGLADAGLAGHQGDGGLVARHHLGGVDDADEAGEGAGPAHHDRAHADATAEHHGRRYEPGQATRVVLTGLVAAHPGRWRVDEPEMGSAAVGGGAATPAAPATGAEGAVPGGLVHQVPAVVVGELDGEIARDAWLAVQRARLRQVGAIGRSTYFRAEQARRVVTRGTRAVLP